jgi:hypothetical protein
MGFESRKVCWLVCDGPPPCGNEFCPKCHKPLRLLFTCPRCQLSAFEYLTPGCMTRVTVYGTATTPTANTADWMSEKKEEQK